MVEAASRDFGPFRISVKAGMRESGERWLNVIYASLGVSLIRKYCVS